MAAEPASDVKPGDRRAHGLGIDVDAALPVVRCDRRFHEVVGKAQSELAEALAVGRVSVDLGRVAVVEAGEVTAIIARPPRVNFLRQRLELNGVGTIGQRIVLLLVEKLLALGVDHPRRFFRAEHRIGIDLHALPRRRIGDVVGVPPLHFEIGKRCANAPCHCDPITGHLASAGRPRVQAVGVAGCENDGTRQHDNVFACDVIKSEHAAHRTVLPAQECRDRGLLETWDSRPHELLAA